MQNPNFCLRMQSLDNSSDEIFWDGREFLSSNSDGAIRCLKGADFVYENGVVWISESDVEAKFHFSGLMLLSLTPLELDEAGRKAPLSITLNLTGLSKSEFINNLQAITSSLGRSFAPGFLDSAANKVAMLIGKGYFYLLIRFLFVKYFGRR